MTVHVVEVRHHGETIRYKVDSLEDYVSGVVVDANGKPRSFDRQAKELQSWFDGLALEGVEARAATITLPPISLDVLFDNPGRDRDLQIGSVCDKHDLFIQAKAAGAYGTIFVAEDVEPMLQEAGNADYNELSAEEKSVFVAENWEEFARRVGDSLSQHGNDHIRTEVAMQLNDLLSDFKSKHSAHGM
jgi:dsDNA-binding SOS-regulon protein